MMLLHPAQRMFFHYRGKRSTITVDSFVDEPAGALNVLRALNIVGVHCATDSAAEVGEHFTAS